MTEQEAMTASDLGVWTYADCALVLIDYQKEMFAKSSARRRTPTWSTSTFGDWPRRPKRST